MTVPTDTLAATVREAFEKLRSAGRMSDILKVWCDDGIEALAELAARASQAEADLERALTAGEHAVEQAQMAVVGWEAEKDAAARLREERDALVRDRERWRLEWQAEVKTVEARWRFCPHCAGAFVPEAGYEGPCEGCKIAGRLKEEVERLREVLARVRPDIDQETGYGRIEAV